MKKSLELNEILSGKNINFLIGAGASATAYKTLNILNDKSNNTSLEDLLSSEEINDDNKKILYYWYFKEWISPMRDILNDDEQDSKVKENLDNYNRFVETIISFLQNESNKRPKRINIFTTNYDLMFEKAFEKILNKKEIVYFNDGSTGLLERNFKYNNSMKGIVVLFCLKSVTLNSYEILSVKYKIKTINPVSI